MKYEDDYTACSRTYSTLRIFPNKLTPEEITEKLQIEPSDVSYLGGGRKGQHVNGWFLSSENKIESKDSRRHIDWLLDHIEPVANVLESLRKNGAEIDISCYWESSSGNGGPTISPQQMNRLVKHNIEVWWDVYFSDDAV